MLTTLDSSTINSDEYCIYLDISKSGLDSKLTAVYNMYPPASFKLIGRLKVLCKFNTSLSDHIFYFNIYQKTRHHNSQRAYLSLTSEYGTYWSPDIPTIYYDPNIRVSYNPSLYSNNQDSVESYFSIYGRIFTNIIHQAGSIEIERFIEHDGKTECTTTTINSGEYINNTYIDILDYFLYNLAKIFPDFFLYLLENTINKYSDELCCFYGLYNTNVGEEACNTIQFGERLLSALSLTMVGNENAIKYLEKLINKITDKTIPEYPFDFYTQLLKTYATLLGCEILNSDNRITIAAYSDDIHIYGTLVPYINYLNALVIYSFFPNTYSNYIVCFIDRTENHEKNMLNLYSINSAEHPLSVITAQVMDIINNIMTAYTDEENKKIKKDCIEKLILSSYKNIIFDNSKEDSIFNINAGLCRLLSDLSFLEKRSDYCWKAQLIIFFANNFKMSIEKVLSIILSSEYSGSRFSSLIENILNKKIDFGMTFEETVRVYENIYDIGEINFNPKELLYKLDPKIFSKSTANIIGNYAIEISGYTKNYIKYNNVGSILKILKNPKYHFSNDNITKFSIKPLKINTINTKNILSNIGLCKSIDERANMYKMLGTYVWAEMSTNNNDTSSSKEKALLKFQPFMIMFLNEYKTLKKEADKQLFRDVFYQFYSSPVTVLFPEPDKRFCNIVKTLINAEIPSNDKIWIYIVSMYNHACTLLIDNGSEAYFGKEISKKLESVQDKLPPVIQNRIAYSILK